MKLIFYIFFVFSPLCHYPQTFTVSGTSQGWVGGICCRSGVNHTVTVNTGITDIDSLEIVSVCLEGRLYSPGMISLSKYHNSFTVSFGYSQDSNKYIKEDISLYKKEYQRPCETNTVVFKLNGEIFTLAIKEIKELPYIAYP